MPSLEEMKIDLEGIGHALSDNLLSVPMYQRSYAWEDQHVNDLFQDFGSAITNNESEYFLGSIVVTRDAGDRPEVVDGQQRLATTTILLAAFRDWFFKQGDQDRSNDIELSYLVERDLRTQELNARLRLNEVDHDFFMKKILSKPSDASRDIRPTKESHLRIERAAQLAEEHVGRIVGLLTCPR